MRPTPRLVCAVLVAAACHRQQVAAADTLGPTELRGALSITGTAFEQQMMLRAGTRVTRLFPANVRDSAALVRLDGVDIGARGTLDEKGLRVASFTALSVSGLPVYDGIVRVDGKTVELETANGRVALGNPPEPLRQMAGARVWVGGPIERGPNNYGVIVPR